jgi:hypothetical protein
MARIKQPTSESMDAFRNTPTTRNDKSAFDALVRLITTSRSDIGWHHEVGRRVAEIVTGEGSRVRVGLSDSRRR